MSRLDSINPQPTAAYIKPIYSPGRTYVLKNLPRAIMAKTRSQVFIE
jgi:hypothetical protein